jgi:hypothetical protein
MTSMHLTDPSTPPRRAKSAPLNTLLFGGCLVHAPVRHVSRTQNGLAYRKYGVMPIHTFGEMFQIVEILRGEKTVPPELRHLCRMATELAPVPGASDFSDIDVALVEPASPIELTFRGIAINRTGIMHHVLRPIERQGSEAAKISARWLRQGLVGLNESVRAETGAKLLDYVQGQTEEAELARAVIRETHASRSDIAGGFRKMQELLGCPIGVAIYVFRYMPDGRPVSWPAGFREDVLAAARQLDLPIFEPTPLVLQYGVEAALTADSRHYREEFLPVIGDALVEFARSVYEGSKSRPAAS